MASVPAINGITREQFLQLLIAQLQNQDPLNPITDQQFLSQLTALNTLQEIQALNVSFSQVLKLQQLVGGTTLIGRHIAYVPPGGGPLQNGVVQGLSVLNGEYVLHIGNDRVPLDAVRSVT